MTIARKYLLAEFPSSQSSQNTITKIREVPPKQASQISPQSSQQPVEPHSYTAFALSSDLFRRLVPCFSVDRPGHILLHQADNSFRSLWISVWCQVGYAGPFWRCFTQSCLDVLVFSGLLDTKTHDKAKRRRTKLQDTAYEKKDSGVRDGDHRDRK